MKLDVLQKMYKAQQKLDSHILQNHNLEMSKEELLKRTILAMLVEIGELANATRCFKHWSTKGSERKGILLDEVADIMHFYLSIGNQLGFKLMLPAWMRYLNGGTGEWLDLNDAFLDLYTSTSKLVIFLKDPINKEYQDIGKDLVELYWALGFTHNEVEKAYYAKHEENYQRQKEGY